MQIFGLDKEVGELKSSGSGGDLDDSDMEEYD